MADDRTVYISYFHGELVHVCSKLAGFNLEITCMHMEKLLYKLGYNIYYLRQQKEYNFSTIPNTKLKYLELQIENINIYNKH